MSAVRECNNQSWDFKITSCVLQRKQFSTATKQKKKKKDFFTPQLPEL